MNNHFKLTRQQNIFLAKKLFVESVHCGAKLEGSNITFPQTQTILDGVNVASVTLDDIQTVLNLRDAWRYLIQNVEKPFDLEFLCALNGFIARNESLEWGVLRYGSVGISGTSFVPEMPNKEKVIAHISELNGRHLSATEQAIEYFLWGTRSQLFWDGNKRTSLLAANKILISEGAGILTIPDEQIPIFNELLKVYYETGNGRLLAHFLHEKCIRGITFEQEMEPDEEELER